MNILRGSLLAVITLGLVVLSVPAQARIKCWENSDGVRECGENVPPEYSQKSHKKISRHGVTIEETDRAKTEEERAEEERLVTIQEEEERKKADIEKQDKMLLDTYSNTYDIQLTSDGKVAALESTIRLMSKRNEKIQANLGEHTTTVAELAGKEPSKDLLKDIRSLKRQINNNNKFITKKRMEQETIKKEYADKIARFEQLTN